MTRNKPNVVGSRSALVATIAAVMALAWPSTGSGQDQPPDQAKHDHQHSADARPTETGDSLADQVRQLRDKVAKLEAALSQGHGAGQSSPMVPGQGKGIGARAGDTGLGQGVRVSAKYQNCLQCHQTRLSSPLPSSYLEKAGDIDMGAMEGGGLSGRGNPAQGMATGKGMMGRELGRRGQGMGMGMMGGGMEMTGGEGMMGMRAMGQAKRMSMGHMGMATTLPGFPGVSHLYHIGADGFFLNHVEHITLSTDQRKKLNQSQQKAMLGGSSCGRKAEQAEQELWELTASDAPDGVAIEAKVREIEKHQGDQRITFIRAVGEAAKVLTDKQRAALTDATSDAAAPATTPP